MSKLMFDVNDKRDFPSLGGGSQAAQNHPSAIWPPRAGQQAVQRQTNQQQSQPSNQQPEKEQGHEGLFRGIDDFRSGQGPSTQLPSNQQPPSNADDFPSLRDTAGTIGPERRGSQLQSAGYAGFAGAPGFGGINQQQRNPLSNPLGGQQDGPRLTSPSAASGGKLAPLTDVE